LPGASPTVQYVTGDHLGSTATITDKNGNLILAESFSPWGARRSPANWTVRQSAADAALLATTMRQGFTGHEHVDNLDQINMNGRMYQGAGFMSPDPHITDPTNPQDYNRYAYVENNPLTFIDPSGFDQVCFGASADDLIAPIVPDLPYYEFDENGNPVQIPSVAVTAPLIPSQNCFELPTLQQISVTPYFAKVFLSAASLNLNVALPLPNTQCSKGFLNTAPTTTPVDAPVTNPALIILAALTGGLLSGDTPQSQRPSIYYHYGYAAQAPLFAGGMRPGSYGTPDLVTVSGATAQQIYALPPQNAVDSPPNAIYTITAPPGTPVQDLGPVGPTTFPGPVNPTGQDVTRTGGGNEVFFPQGTPPGSVSGPNSLPSC
ncbi:MAG TPA: RHS repeat-associated core domain-containing protein, partial [Steroidobacteraceae bacterium]|nr:RHS repeat-associated core domain-containing protein [Steroidobacteraceae bacterium]